MSSALPRVLVVDDDPRLADLVQDYLQARGMEVVTVDNGAGALERVRAQGFELVVLDVMMPGLDGFEVLRELRKDRDIPVIMLTARGEDTDRIVGLELGADDYLAKPFNPRELLARIKAVLRRASPTDASADGAIEASGIRLDVAARAVWVHGETVELTTTEFEILRALLASAGRVIPRERLMELARENNGLLTSEAWMFTFRTYEKKLGDDPKSPQKIKTIRGVGYMIPKVR